MFKSSSFSTIQCQSKDVQCVASGDVSTASISTLPAITSQVRGPLHRTTSTTSSDLIHSIGPGAAIVVFIRMHENMLSEEAASALVKILTIIECRPKLYRLSRKDLTPLHLWYVTPCFHCTLIEVSPRVLRLASPDRRWTFDHSSLVRPHAPVCLSHERVSSNNGVLRLTNKCLAPINGTSHGLPLAISYTVSCLISSHFSSSEAFYNIPLLSTVHRVVTQISLNADKCTHSAFL